MTTTKVCQCFKKWGECHPDCPGEFEPRNRKQIYCPACASTAQKIRKRRRSYNHYIANKNDYNKKRWVKDKQENRQPCNAFHQCLCPRCEREYMMRVFWTGKGTPRIYCPSCRTLETNSPDVETYAFLEGVTRRGRYGQ